MADFATLIFLLGQLGMALGLGAATFSLMFHFTASVDGRVDATEARFIAATRTTLAASLFLIVVTGGLITAAHILADEQSIVMAPAFLGKWGLIGILILSGVAHRLSLIPAPIAGIISGASWYALFIVHTLAPDVSWPILGAGYALWLCAFAIGFVLVGKAAKETLLVAAVPQKATPQALLKPQPAPPAVKQTVPPKKAAAPAIEFNLPQGPTSH